MSELLHRMILLQQFYVHRTPTGLIFPLARDEALSLKALGWQGIELATVGDEEFINERYDWLKYVEGRQGC